MRNGVAMNELRGWVISRMHADPPGFNTRRISENSGSSRPRGAARIHADEIERGIAAGKFFSQRAHQRDLEQPRLLEHAFARIQADDAARVAHDDERLAGDEPGAGGDIEPVHAGEESGPLQRRAPAPRPAAEPQQPLDEIVVARGVVEEMVEEPAAAGLVRPVAAQGGDRGARDGSRVVRLVKHAGFHSR